MVVVRSEPDVVIARRRARQLAELVGFGTQDQTTLSTVVSEMARKAVRRAGGGVVEFGLKPHPPELTVRIEDREEPLNNFVDTGDLIPLEELVDTISIEKVNGVSTMVLGKVLPPNAPKITPELAMQIAGELSGQGALTAFEEVRQQNQALLVLLEQRARVEAELKRNRESLQLAMDTAQLGTWEYVPATGQLICSDRCRLMHGVRREEPLTLDILFAGLSKEDRNMLLATIQESAAAEGPIGFELDYLLPKVDRWVTTRGRVLRQEEGPRIIAAVLDITSRKRQEEATREQAKFQQQLVGIVSHDLKNPLQVIMAASQVLKDAGGLTPRQMEVLARVRRATDRANQLIRDLLDFTQERLGEGLPVSRTRADLRAIVYEVAESFRIAGIKNSIEIEVEGEVVGNFDPDRMNQVVTNLVDNAVTHAPKGEPVTIRVCGTSTETVLSVHNPGKPIEPHLIAKLFEPLQQDGDGQRNKKRIGLGLFIVKAIAEAHGGTVTARSKAGDGTTVEVRLPR